MKINCLIKGYNFLNEEEKEFFEGLMSGDELELKHEIGNEYDEYAVIATYDNVKVGYIDRKVSKEICQLVESGKIKNVTVLEFQTHGSYGPRMFVEVEHTTNTFIETNYKKYISEKGNKPQKYYGTQGLMRYWGTEWMEDDEIFSKVVFLFSILINYEAGTLSSNTLDFRKVIEVTYDDLGESIGEDLSRKYFPFNDILDLLANSKEIVKSYRGYDGETNYFLNDDQLEIMLSYDNPKEILEWFDITNDFDEFLPYAGESYDEEVDELGIVTRRDGNTTTFSITDDTIRNLSIMHAKEKYGDIYSDEEIEAIVDEFLASERE